MGEYIKVSLERMLMGSTLVTPFHMLISVLKECQPPYDEHVKWCDECRPHTPYAHMMSFSRGDLIGKVSTSYPTTCLFNYRDHIVVRAHTDGGNHPSLTCKCFPFIITNGFTISTMNKRIILLHRCKKISLPLTPKQYLRHTWI